ncbi:MAG: energy transducer TonB [Bacteroidales bacterium]|nr:energy transducer TonB [Bacteroidales bacterium]
METKKTPRANLENKKTFFTEIGLAISLGIVLVAFEWTSRDVQIVIDALPTEFTVEEDLVPVTTQDEQPKLLPPPPKLADIINITDNDAEIDEDLELINSEIDDNTEISYQNIEVEAEDEEDDDNAIFFTAEEMPIFPGGESALMKYLAQSVKYPAIAQDNGVQGRVFVSFVIDKNGDVTDVKVMRPTDPNLDKEAIRVVKSMPKWTPGKQRGKAVKVSYTVPINFVLQ